MEATHLVTTSESWTAYVRRVTEGMEPKYIAAAAGIDQSSVSRWLNGSPHRPKAEKVVALARAMHQSPLEALVRAGYLDEAELGKPVTIVQPLSALSDDALLAELDTRLRRRLGLTGEPRTPMRPLRDDTRRGRNET
jgi:transcriptional regulator with XRE-family HTH domain